jgi:hypothetical protein
MHDPEFSCSLQTARQNPQEQKTRRRRSRSSLKLSASVRSNQAGNHHEPRKNPGNEQKKRQKQKHQLNSTSPLMDTHDQASTKDSKPTNSTIVKQKKTNTKSLTKRSTAKKKNRQTHTPKTEKTKEKRKKTRK